MRTQVIGSLFALALLILLAGLASCSMPNARQDATATRNATQAYQTVNALLTQAVAQTPSPAGLPATTTPGLPAASSTPAPAAQASPTPAPSNTAASTTTANCDLAAPGIPFDVAIPDDEQMTPGQPFTKVWRLVNNGACTWNNGYSVSFFSGEAMGAPASVQIPREVPPGQSIDVSVEMFAPLNPGTHQGNWKMRNPSGGWFGIGPDGGSPFWVRVVVVPSTTVTATLPTPTITATPTPAVLASGVLSPALGGQLDLNRAQLVTEGGDLAYESAPDGRHQLAAQGSVLMGVYGANPPSLQDCRSAPLSATVVTLEELAPATYLCYRTSLGLPGWARLVSFNPADSALTLEILTWSLP